MAKRRLGRACFGPQRHLQQKNGLHAPSATALAEKGLQARAAAARAVGVNDAGGPGTANDLHRRARTAVSGRQRSQAVAAATEARDAAEPDGTGRVAVGVNDADGGADAAASAVKPLRRLKHFDAHRRAR